jgi:hypothetical protein
MCICKFHWTGHSSKQQIRIFNRQDRAQSKEHTNMHGAATLQLKQSIQQLRDLACISWACSLSATCQGSVLGMALSAYMLISLQSILPRIGFERSVLNKYVHNRKFRRDGNFGIFHQIGYPFFCLCVWGNTGKKTIQRLDG